MNKLIKRYGEAAVELAQELGGGNIEQCARTNFLYNEHNKFIEENYPGSQYNFGWAQGSHFVTSKIYQPDQFYIESRFRCHNRDDIIHEIL